jgi:hypothetical protein
MLPAVGIDGTVLRQSGVYSNFHLLYNGNFIILDDLALILSRQLPIYNPFPPLDDLTLVSGMRCETYYTSLARREPARLHKGTCNFLIIVF